MGPPPRPLHILMTTDAVGGVWVFATSLARALCQNNCRVTLVSLGPRPRKDQLWPLRGVPGLALEITDLALEWMDPEGTDAPRALERLAAIERRVAPDVVHLNSFREARGDWSAPILLTAHSCVGSWWDACRGGRPQAPRWTRYGAGVKAGLAAANRWVAPTAAFRDEIERLYAPPTPGRVIRNGLDEFQPMAAKQPFILAAGRMWDEAKNLAAVAAAAPDVEWPVRVAGPLRASGGEEYGPPKAVQSLGELPHDELLALMRRAAIFASPAVYEPFGLTVLEAAAAGCALVLSNIPTFRELWDGAALFVDPRDSRALGHALRALIRRPMLRQTLQRRATARARRYALSATYSGYRSAYDAILDSTAPDSKTRVRPPVFHPPAEART